MTSKHIYFSIIKGIKEGKTITDISMNLGISKQALNRYVSTLKREGCIRKLGYGTWEYIKDLEVKEVNKVTATQSKLLQGKPESNRGHAFIFTLKLPNLDNWNRRSEYLRKQNIPYKQLKNLGGGQSISIKGYTIHLKRKTLIIYDNNNYFSYLAKDTKKQAIFNILALLRHLEGLLKVNLTINKKFQFKVRREHYSLIKDALAKQRIKEGKPYFTASDSKGVWFLIDNSYNLAEAETIRVNEAVNDNEGLQNFLNSHKRTNWEVTPDYTLKMFNNLIEDRQYWATHIKSHVAAIQELGKAVKTLTEKVVNNKNKNLR